MKEIVIVASAQYDKSRLMGSEIDSFKEVVKMTTTTSPRNSKRW